MSAGTIKLASAPASAPGARPTTWAVLPPGLKVALVLSAVVDLLMIASSAAGLLVRGIYHEAPWAEAALRGGDLVTLVLAAPLLALAIAGVVRGSPRARLVWAGMLGYGVYNGAYYVFGTTFNQLFLAHVVLLASALYALVFGLSALGAERIGRSVRSWAGARVISGFLLVVAAGLGGLWTFMSLRYAVTGELPASGVIPVAAVHLVYALDLTLMASTLTVAAVLLWRRTAWGWLSAAAVSVMAAVYQVNLMAANAFAAEAKVPGAQAFSPAGLALALAFAVAAGVLLGRVRPGLTDRPTGRTPS
jgi:hypothetical protein